MNTHPSRDNRHIISLTTTLSIPHRGGWESGKLGDCRSTLLTALSLSKGEIGGIRRLARLGPVGDSWSKVQIAPTDSSSPDEAAALRRAGLSAGLSAETSPRAEASAKADAAVANSQIGALRSPGKWPLDKRPVMGVPGTSA